MSQSKSIPKLISRFYFGFDDETKVEINALKSKLDEVTRALSVKNDSHGDRLLAAMQAEAVNDSYDIGLGDCLTLGRELDERLNNDKSELKQLGQWVFDGMDANWKFAAVDGCTGRAYVYEEKPHHFHGRDYWGIHYGKQSIIGHNFDTSDWKKSLIERATVNDVDYLSNALDESVPPIDDTINQSDWLSESAPQITQADMQLIFINNLSAVLIQRMHSMNRFSHDDYTIGGDKLMPWDIVFDNVAQKFGVITGINRFGQTCAIFLGKLGDSHSSFDSWSFHLDSLLGKATATVTKGDLPAFRAALEACYA